MLTVSVVSRARAIRPLTKGVTSLTGLPQPLNIIDYK